MPDSSTVDQMIANPQTGSPMASMGNLLQMAQGIQAYKTGQIQQAQAQQALEGTGIDLQVKQQANQERQNIINAIKNKDPAFMPDPNTGLVDQAAAHARYLELAPQTGEAYYQNVVDGNKKATDFNDSLLKLNSDTRADLSGTLLSSVGKGKAQAAQNIADWSATTNTPQAKAIANQILGHISNLKDDDTAGVDAILSHGGMRVQNADTIAKLGVPQTSLVNQGNVASLVVTQPNFSGTKIGSTVGNPISLGISPGEQETVQTDNAGNVYAVVKDPKTNRITGYRPLQPVGGAAPGSAPPAWNLKPNALPIGQTGAYPPVKESVGFANKARADLDSNASLAVQNAINNQQGIGTSLATISHARNAIENSPSFAFGPGKEIPNGFVGFFGGYSNPQEASAYLDRLAVDSMAQSGAPHTNAGLSAAQHLSGNPNVMGAEALQEKLRNTEATLRMAQDYSTAVANRYAGHNNYGADKAQFDSAFAGAANPDIWRFEQAVKNNDKAELDRLIGPTGVYSTKEQIADLQAKRKKIQSMIPGF